jgi:hypothetical protein
MAKITSAPSASPRTCSEECLGHMGPGPDAPLCETPSYQCYQCIKPNSIVRNRGVHSLPLFGMSAAQLRGIHGDGVEELAVERRVVVGLSRIGCAFRRARRYALRAQLRRDAGPRLDKGT